MFLFAAFEGSFVRRSGGLKARPRLVSIDMITVNAARFMIDAAAEVQLSIFGGAGAENLDPADERVTAAKFFSFSSHIH